jgi:hypothetical protein
VESHSTNNNRYSHSHGQSLHLKCPVPNVYWDGEAGRRSGKLRKRRWPQRGHTRMPERRSTSAIARNETSSREQSYTVRGEKYWAIRRLRSHVLWVSDAIKPARQIAVKISTPSFSEPLLKDSPSWSVALLT